MKIKKNWFKIQKTDGIYNNDIANHHHLHNPLSNINFHDLKTHLSY